MLDTKWSDNLFLVGLVAVGFGVAHAINNQRALALQIDALRNHLASLAEADDPSDHDDGAAQLPAAPAGSPKWLTGQWRCPSCNRMNDDQNLFCAGCSKLRNKRS